MAIKVRLKHSSVDSKAPVAADLLDGEIALNINENSPAAYIKNSAGQIVKLAGAGSVTDEASVKKVGDTMTGPLVLSGAPVADDQASNKKYVDDVAAAAVTTADDKYVDVAGDNMTGDLTLGTDKIVLDAGTGGATFAGSVNAGGNLEAGYSLKCNKDGALAANTKGLILHGVDGSAGADAFSVTAGGDTFVSGGAEFAGRVDVGTAAVPVATDTAISAINNSSEPTIYIDNKGTGELSIEAKRGASFGGYVESTVEDTYAFKVNGGGLYANGADGVALYLKDGGDYPVGAWNASNGGLLQLGTGDSSAYLITLDGNNGSANFAGDVIAGDFFTTTATGALLSSTGSVMARQQNDFGVIWQGFKSNNNVTSSITAGGDATFSGNVDVGVAGLEKYASLKNDGRATLLNGDNSQYVWINSVTGDGAIVVNNTNSSTASTAKAVITKDGSASFAGEIKVNRSSFNVDLGAGNYGTLIYSKSADIARVLLQGSSDVGGTGVAQFSITADGSATFAGTVTATVVPPSDARFKENIEPAKPQLADVVALGGLLKNYDWNDQAPLNEEIRSQRQLGLIAQEAETVCPTIVKDIHRTKQGDVITPEEIIPAVYEDKVIPAEYKTIIVAPAKLGPKGKEIVPATTEEVLVTPEYTEQVLVTPEKVIPATYEELDDSYKGISSEALIMKLIGAVAELSAEVTALKAVKTANWQPGEVGL